MNEFTPIRSILVPFDMSEQSLQAVTLAKQLQIDSGVSIHLLYAATVEEASPIGVGDATPALRKEIRQMIDGALESECIHTRIGLPSSTIVKFANDKDIDLIVMTTHGRTGLTHLLLGSVAESVVRNATCPVLTVKAGKEQFSNLDFSGRPRILIPIDFSSLSQAVIPLVDGLFGSQGADVHLLHVAEQPEPVMVAPDVVVPVGVVESEAPGKHDLFTRLQQVALPVRMEASCNRMVKDGDPASAIVDYANEKDIDLIVMSTHGHTWLKHLIMGSVAESVVRNAPCPVLTLKATQD